MVVSVTGTVPDSTLTPRQVQQKFSPQTLAGLRGLGCDNYDFDSGACLDDGSTTIDTWDPYGAPPVDFGALPYANQPDGSCWPFDPSCAGGTPVTHGATINGGPYLDIEGNIVTTYSDGTFSQISPSGKVTSGKSVVGTIPSATQGGSITQAQASAWPQMINALASAGVKLGTVAMLQPGQTLLPNGTVVGTGQSVFGTSVNSSLSSIFSNPMLLIGGFGVLALALLAGGGRR